MTQRSNGRAIQEAEMLPTQIRNGDGGADDKGVDIAAAGKQTQIVEECQDHKANAPISPSAAKCKEILSPNDPSVDLEKQDTRPKLVDNISNFGTWSTRQATQDGDLSRQVSKDVHGNVYPEGGLRAWLVVYGAWSGMTASFGIMNTVGTFQAYFSTHQLANLEPATIGWIFSLYTFLSFFLGIQIGPLFDAKGPRVLVLLGTLCIVGGTLGLAESTSKCGRSLS